MAALSLQEWCSHWPSVSAWLRSRLLSKIPRSCELARQAPPALQLRPANRWPQNPTDPQASVGWLEVSGPTAISAADLCQDITALDQPWLHDLGGVGPLHVSFHGRARPMTPSECSWRGLTACPSADLARAVPGYKGLAVGVCEARRQSVLQAVCSMSLLALQEHDSAEAPLRQRLQALAQMQPLFQVRL